MIEGIAGFIVASLAVASASSFEDTPIGPGWLSAVLYVVLFDLVQRVSSRRALRHVIEARQGLRPSGRVSRFPLIFLQALGLFAVQLLGWRHFIDHSLGLADVWFVEEALLILPWVFVYLSLLIRQRTLRALLANKAPWPYPDYLVFHLRLLVIPAILVGMNVVESRLADPSRSIGRWLQFYPTAAYGVFMAWTLLLVVFSPFLVRLAFPTRSMRPGPLRSRFEALAAHAGFRFMDIRVCPTHGYIMNAAFVGVLGRLRYVVFTDAILERLSDDDLVGVFAHEMGHSQRRHIPMNLVLFMGFSLAMFAMSGGGLATTEPGVMDAVIPLVAFPVFLFLVFSPVARSFETEADVYAGEILGDRGPIVRSLSALGWIYPSKRHKGGLVHPSIDERLEFLERYFEEPSVAAEFRLKMKRVRRGILVFGLVPLLLTLARLPGELQTGRVRTLIAEAVVEDDEALALDAWRELEPLLERGFRDPGRQLSMQLWVVLASGRLNAGDAKGALPWLDRVQKVRDELEGPVELYNAAILAAEYAAAVGDWPRLSREIPLARKHLEAIAARWGEDDEQVVRERGDLDLLEDGLGLVEAAGVLPRFSEARPWRPLPEGPARRLLESLKTALEGDRTPSSFTLDPADLEALSPGWKADFLERVVQSLRRRFSR
ncbi:MAG TPA: hypothetical protein ENK43_16225 [Planctomycetes bacterium]|nr:hypothetical protein [Planctomycetota bacterium]